MDNGLMIVEFSELVGLRKERFNPEFNQNNKVCIELEHIESGTGKLLGNTLSNGQKSSKNVFYKGDVLFGKLRPYLKKYWLAEFNGVCSSEIWVLMPKTSKVDPKYFFYRIQNHDFIMAANVSSGSKMPRSDWNFIINYPLSIIHSIPEQRAIAACLGTWDNAIQKLTELIAQKELRKKWLMQVLLTGKKRLKGFDGELKEYTLNEIFIRITRMNSNSCENVVTISARDGFIKQTDFFSKTIASEVTSNYFLVNKGEFCYNKSYSNGYPCGATKRLKDFDSAVVTTLYICFGIKEGSENSADFFEYYFAANLLDKGLTKIAHEGGRAHGLLNVTPTDFFSLKIAIPEKPEQLAIAKILQLADNELSLLKEKMARIKEQKRGLMQVLFTGKKRLNIN